MEQFCGQVVNGLMAGSIYALIAVAFNLIFGVLRVVYFAHGQVMVLGAYVAFGALLWTHSIVLAFVFAALAGGVLGGVMERVLVRPLIGKHHLMPLVSTVSAGVIIEETIRLTVKQGQLVSFPQRTVSGWPVWHLGTISIGLAQVLVAVVALLLVVVLSWAIRHTWYGRGVRAIAQSRDRSATLGVDISRTSSMTFALSSALTGIGGVLFGLIYVSFDPYFGQSFGIKSLAVVLLGGLGSVTGAAVGGLLLGVVEALAAGYLATSWQDAFAFGLMMVILLVRPGGLVGATQDLD